MANPPVSIGRYQVVRPIGQGGMGSLYLVWDPKLERQIAIKLLKDDDDELRERFSREARAAARLRHPHIVTIFDVGDHDGQPFIAMEFVQGETLADVIKQRQPLPASRKIELIEELCDGLGFAHKSGIVHRDIKPANIMVDHEGSLKILDFGIARAVESAGMTQAGMLIGTLNYMSPEQVSGQAVDHRSDIFAVGTVFYELLAYRQAFPGSLLGGILNKILHEAPDPLSDLVRGLHPDIVRVVERAIAKDPKDRYQELASMRKELQALRFRFETGSNLPTQVYDPSAAGPQIVQTSTPAPTPNKPTPTPRRTANREELARRRAGQIQAQLEEARSAFNGGDFEASIAACEQALMLDNDEAQALELLDKARSALEDRQVKDWLETARKELSRGALTSARGFVDRVSAVNPSAPGIQELQQALEQALVQRVQEQERNDTIKRALEQGQASFDSGAFEDAERSAAEILALDPAHAEGRALQARAVTAREALDREALNRRAQDAIAEAKRLFGAGQHQPAIDLLGKFTPRHDQVTRAADQMKADASRIAAELRHDAEQQARQQRLTAGITEARARVARADFAGALEQLRGLEKAEGTSAELRAAINDAQAAQVAADRAAAVQRELTQAADLQARHDLKGALARVDAALALAPANDKARALKTSLQDAIRAETERQKAEERAERERQQNLAAALKKARKAPTAAAAIETLHEALRIDPGNAEATKLLAERQAARDRDQQQTQRAVPRTPPEAPADATIMLTPRQASAATADATVIQARPAKPAPAETPARPMPVVPAPPPSPVRAAAPQPSSLSSTDETRPLDRPSSKNNIIYIAGAAAVVVLAIVGYFVLSGPKEPGSSGTAVAQNTPAPTTSSPTPSPVQTAAPSPAATSTPVASTAPTPAATPATTPGARGAAADPKLTGILNRAQQQYRAGDKAGALASAMEGWRINRQDPTLVALLGQWTQEARAEANAARGRADAVGTAATSTASYQEGRSEMDAAASGTPTQIFDRYQHAEDLFGRAEAEGKRKNAEPRNIPTTPVPTAVPTPTTQPAGPPVVTAGSSGGTNVPPPPPPVDENARIRTALRLYEQAYGARDVDALVAVAVNQRGQANALKQAFSGMERQSCQILVDTIRVEGNTATVDGTRVNSVTPKGAREQTARTKISWRLRKEGDRWIIFEMR